MNWSDIGSIIGKSAPLVGTLLGGPAGAAVGALVANALGVNSDPDAVNSVLAGNPEALIELQEARNERAGRAATTGGSGPNHRDPGRRCAILRRSRRQG